MGNFINIFKGSCFGLGSIISGVSDYNIINSLADNYTDLPNEAKIFYYGLILVATSITSLFAVRSYENFTKKSDLEKKLESV